MEEEAVFPRYLCNKFSLILREAENDGNTPPQMLSRFRSIQGRIDGICNNDAVSSIPVELLYDLIDAMSECRIFAQKAAATAKPFFRLLNRFFFTKKMMRRLDDIETKFKGSHHPQPPTSLRPPKSKSMTKETSPPLSDTSTIFGLESEAQKIEALLMPDSVAGSSSKGADKEKAFIAIGIVGIRCGCGKTSLAQKVFSSPKVKSEFFPRIWVCLSNMMLEDEDVVDPRNRVVIKILKELGQEVSDAEYSNITKLLEKLHRKLKGKRYLIVLDDAWEMDEWLGDLGYSLPRGYPMGEFLSHGLAKGSGGAVIVTSRWESVVKTMVGNDDMNVISLDNKLSDDICWALFCHHLGGRLDPNTTRLKKDVISLCDGLPLAAKILATSILLRDGSEIIHDQEVEHDPIFRG